MTAEIDSFDLDAAILRKNERDIRAFLSAFAIRLESALPGRVSVERKRDSLFSSSTHVVRIEMVVDDAMYVLAVDRAGISTMRAKVVRGVTISNAPLAAKAWLEEVRAAVARLSGASDEASSAIGKFL